MYAVQGPNAVDLVEGVAEESVSDLERFEARYATIGGVDCWTARTGYTGEDGFELLVPWAAAEEIWTALDCQPGFGARDTLRIEAGFLLAGRDFDADTDPRTPYEPASVLPSPSRPSSSVGTPSGDRGDGSRGATRRLPVDRSRRPPTRLRHHHDGESRYRHRHQRDDESDPRATDRPRLRTGRVRRTGDDAAGGRPRAVQESKS